MYEESRIFETEVEAKNEQTISEAQVGVECSVEQTADGKWKLTCTYPNLG